MLALVKKEECERALRHLCHVWWKESGLSATSEGHPSFTQFFAWVVQNYPSYLNFRTTITVSFEVDMWFDQEFKQTWRT